MRTKDTVTCDECLATWPLTETRSCGCHDRKLDLCEVCAAKHIQVTKHRIISAQLRMGLKPMSMQTR